MTGQKPLTDKDAYWALKDASLEDRLRYDEIRSKRRAKSQLTKDELVFVRRMRSLGRQMANERADAAFGRLYGEEAG